MKSFKEIREYAYQYGPKKYGPSGYQGSQTKTTLIKSKPKAKNPTQTRKPDMDAGAQAKLAKNVAGGKNLPIALRNKSPEAKADKPVGAQDPSEISKKTTGAAPGKTAGPKGYSQKPKMSDPRKVDVGTKPVVINTKGVSSGQDDNTDKADKLKKEKDAAIKKLRSKYKSKAIARILKPHTTSDGG